VGRIWRAKNVKPITGVWGGIQVQSPC